MKDAVLPGRTDLGQSKTSLKWILPVAAVFATMLVLSQYSRIAKDPPFLTTSSPGKTYTVYLTGQKERPLFFTVEVHFHVSKNGTTFLSNKYLHSGDSQDLSFEMQYPNHRWINENTIQFYREEYFKDVTPDTLVVVNKTGEAIKYAKIKSVDSVLLFDLQPGFTQKIVTPGPRGDSKWLDVEGEFSDGREIVGIKKNLPQKHLPAPNTYYVYINAKEITLEIRD
jgi:hypothetical protein